MPFVDTGYYIPDRPKNWPKIVLLILGIATFVFLVVFGAPYIKEKLENKIQGDIDDLVNSNSSNDTLGIRINCEEDVYNCGNFTYQNESQQVFDACVEDGAGDIHQLDGDGNQRACESLT